MSKFFHNPQLFHVSEIKPKLDRPKSEMLKAIENGEIEYLDFDARVYRYVQNRNLLTFPEESMPAFAESFAGQPFLRNHETYDIASRDGTILASSWQDNSFVQSIRLTTRRGMTAFVEGQIDRFSIGWYYDAIKCSICGADYYDCNHYPGKKYQVAGVDKTCELIFINPKGKETSAVNAPADEGTGILAALMSLKGENNLMDEPTTPASGGNNPPPASPEQRLQANVEATRAFLGEAERQRLLQEQIEQSNALLIQQAAYVLDSALAASRLPEVTQARLRRQYSGLAFNPAELQASIDEARAEISALTSAQAVQGPGRASGFINGLDEFRAALDDLLGAPREPGMEGKHIRKLSGIREAYLIGTGDVNFQGGFYGENALREFALNTANFPGIVKDSLNKILVESWAQYGAAGYNWWENIVTVENFTTLNQVDWLRTGTIASLPEVAEQAEYGALPIGDNAETSDWKKYGGYVPLTLEAILRDDVRAFRKMPQEVALGGLRNISEQVAAIFTVNSATGPTLADGGALFNATAVTTKGGHANLLTAALGTDYTAWEAAAAAMYNQPMLVKNATGQYGAGKKQAIDPKFILVPRALRGAANNLFLSRAIPGVQTPLSTGKEWYGMVVPITVPEWTDATDWAAVADPKIAPAIMVGEIFGVMPQIFVANGERDGAMFANDENRIKVRQILTVGVADFRALHKSNVAG